MAHFTVNLNMSRNLVRGLTGEAQQLEARRAVKMFLVPKNNTEPISDAMVPDYLVTNEMVTRYIEIYPPDMAVIPEFQEIINEIEHAYVNGQFFSATSSA